MAVEIGTKIEDFILKDNRGKDFKLSDYRGKKILLSFHPLAWTSVCAQQMKALEEHFQELENLNTVAVGVSVDSVPCKNAWAKELGISRTPLLSDFWPHGDLAKKLGIFREKEGFSERANIILDARHQVAFVKVYDIPQLPDIGEILEVLKGL